MKYLNKILIDWGENTADIQNNIITVSEKDLDPKEEDLRIWMKSYHLPKSEIDDARRIKKDYWDGDIINLQQWDACCLAFEAFAMIAYHIFNESPEYIINAKPTAAYLGLYDYSWFDQETENNESIGDYCIKKAASKKYFNDFKIIHNWVKLYIDDAEWIFRGWEVYNTIKMYPVLEPDWDEYYEPEQILVK